MPRPEWRSEQKYLCTLTAHGFAAKVIVPGDSDLPRLKAVETGAMPLGSPKLLGDIAELDARRATGFKHHPRLFRTPPLRCKSDLASYPKSGLTLIYCFQTLVQNYALSAQDFQLLHIFRK